MMHLIIVRKIKKELKVYVGEIKFFRKKKTKNKIGMKNFDQSNSKYHRNENQNHCENYNFDRFD